MTMVAEHGGGGLNSTPLPTGRTMGKRRWYHPPEKSSGWKNSAVVLSSCPATTCNRSVRKVRQKPGKADQARRIKGEACLGHRKLEHRRVVTSWLRRLNVAAPTSCPSLVLCATRASCTRQIMEPALFYRQKWFQHMRTHVRLSTLTCRVLERHDCSREDVLPTAVDGHLRHLSGPKTSGHNALRSHMHWRCALRGPKSHLTVPSLCIGMTKMQSALGMFGGSIHVVSTVCVRRRTTE